VTVHVLATHVETGDEYEATLDYGTYCLVTHGGSFDRSVLPPDYTPVPLVKREVGQC